MSEPLESMLERLGPAPAGRPPPEFINAVARRRARRRLVRAAAGVMVLALVLGVWSLVPKPRPIRPSPIPISRGYSLQETSLAALSRRNSDLDPESLRLPEPEGSGPPPELRPAMTPERLDAVLGH
jgi:hypothetical protein